MQRRLFSDSTNVTNPVLVDRVIVSPDRGLVWYFLANALLGRIASWAGSNSDCMMAANAT